MLPEVINSGFVEGRGRNHRNILHNTLHTQHIWKGDYSRYDSYGAKSIVRREAQTHTQQLSTYHRGWTINNHFYLIVVSFIFILHSVELQSFVFQGIYRKQKCVESAFRAICMVRRLETTLSWTSTYILHTHSGTAYSMHTLIHWYETQNSN